MPRHGASKDPVVTTWRPSGSPPGCLQPSLLCHGAPPDPTAMMRHPPPAIPGIPTGSCVPQTGRSPRANTCPVPPCPAGLGGIRVLGVAVPRARAAGRKGKPSPPAHGRGGRGPLFALPGHLHSGEQRPPLGVPGDAGTGGSPSHSPARRPLPTAGSGSQQLEKCFALVLNPCVCQGWEVGAGRVSPPSCDAHPSPGSR